MSTALPTALQSYRHLIRACKGLFLNDAPRLQAALAEVRTRYTAGRALTAPEQVAEQLQLARDVNIILRQNVVQGVQDKEDAEKYHLRIGAETELGHNDSIKKKGTRPTTNLSGTSGGSCCGGH